MSPAELEAIQARCDAATPGPWRAKRINVDEIVDGPDMGSCQEYEVEDGEEQLFGRVVTSVGLEVAMTHAEGLHDHEAAFIAHARTDIPALIAEVRRLQAEEPTRERAIAQRDAAEKHLEIVRESLGAASKEVERLRAENELLFDQRDASKYQAREAVESLEEARELLTECMPSLHGVLLLSVAEFVKASCTTCGADTKPNVPCPGQCERCGQHAECGCEVQSVLNGDTTRGAVAESLGES